MQSKKFPSPYGELHFSIGKYILFATEAVSVPLRGTTFLNRHISSVILTGFMFPSPYGELHFSIQRCFCKDELQEFPSPYGELHFSMILWWNNHLSDIVSVPLRGTTFLNKISGLHPHRRHVVSVPLRGTTFLN